MGACAVTTAELHPGVRLTIPQLREWLDRKPPPRDDFEPRGNPDCATCGGEGEFMVHGPGKDFGSWFEVCSCAGDEP